MRKIIKKINSTMQSQMIAYMTIVVSCIIGVSSAFASYYFSQTTKNRLLRDYSNLLEYSSSQLELFYNDIRQYGIMIAADDDLQKSISKKENAADMVLKKYKINEVLRPYASLHNSLASIELQTEDGIVYSSETNNKIVGDFNKNSIENLVNTREGLTGVRKIYCANKKISVISFAMPVNNYFDNEYSTAVLYLNIPYQEFEEKIKGDMTDFNWIILQSKKGDIIFFTGNQKENEEKVIEQLGHAEWNQEGIWLKEHEIILKHHMNGNGMDFLMSVTDSYIQKEIKTVKLFFEMLFVVSLIICLSGVCTVTIHSTASIKKMTEAAYKISSGYRSVFVKPEGTEEIKRFINVFNEMTRSIDRQIHEIQLAEKEKNQLKMDILMAQINPHFIYNTLNSVIYLSQMGQNEKVETLVKAFVYLLQDNMKTGVDGMIAEIEEEETCIKNYLTIQAIRYPKRFEREIIIDESIKHRCIPRLILQPFVENSLNHGILTEERMGFIQIKIEPYNGYIRIQIRDNGNGMDETTLKKVYRFEREKHSGNVRSIGISNINERLKLIYKNNYQLNIKTKIGKGCLVELLLPMEIR